MQRARKEILDSITINPIMALVNDTINLTMTPGHINTTKGKMFQDFLNALNKALGEGKDFEEGLLPYMKKANFDDDPTTCNRYRVRIAWNVRDTAQKLIGKLVEKKDYDIRVDYDLIVKFTVKLDFIIGKMKLLDCENYFGRGNIESEKGESV